MLEDPYTTDPMEDSPAEAIYWENFNLAPTDLLSMSQDLDFFFSFDDNDTMQDLCSDPATTSQTGTDSCDLSVTTTTRSRTAPSPNPLNQPDAPDLPTPSDLSASSSSTRNQLSGAVAPGYKAYQKSPWSTWIPVAQDHAYAENQALSMVDECQLMQSTEVRQKWPPALSSPASLSSVPRPMEPAARDAILSMVIQFSKTATTKLLFPSCGLLNILMHAFFVREAARPDPWIHVATFHTDRCRTELLGAVVACGSALFSAAKVWKMGLALQEVVKLAASSAVDHDNQLSRDLQFNQSFMLWVEIAMWSGYRRKMEISESFAFNTVTMLRRAGTFRRNYYAQLSLPDATDDGDAWTQAWYDWVQQQSFKRYAIEIRVSITFGRCPVVSVSELSFTLPAARDLWDASSAEEWKARYLAKRTINNSFTVVDGMYNTGHLAAELDNIDSGLSALAILYAFWGRVWAYTETRAATYQTVTNNSTSTAQVAAAASGAGHWGGGGAQRQELYQSIQTTVVRLQTLHAMSPEARLVSEFLMLSLHAMFEDIQRFAGRYGVGEFKEALPRLQEWVQSDDRYAAAWHAGQVLRAARSFAPTHLRGFPAVAVYQACMTLFVFTVLSKIARGLDTRPGTMRTPSERERLPDILLDGDETMDVRTYLRTGHGRPRLTVSGQGRDLDDPVIIASVLAETFRGNYPSKADPLPSLLDNLASLMRDICNAFVAEAVVSEV
ncbi:hypothetical protein SBRCBS47491_010156 [Sporothrix bragantina]|uniref:Xylanolytic transcriptional activator regulatory domain-containing protein n=1 Tax=Sporothrix bragantina TaxID=671064 RepID=A0ABP0D306_9PEZI